MKNYITLCLRIQFDGQSGQNVSETDVHSLVPWLRSVLTNVGLPHPRPTNVVKPHHGTSDIDMYWDVVSTNPVIKHVCDRCQTAQASTLRENLIVRLMVFFLSYNAREIPSGLPPIVVKQCPCYKTTTAGTGGNGSHSQTSELEARLRTVFESAGISVPPQPQPQNLASYIPMLESYIQALRLKAERETTRRIEAESNLAEEEARHARILLNIKEECREPFVVPALLDAFVALSETVDNVTVSGMNS
ncbi:hypothetical protein H4582DRAFT_1378279 [Lactarius indigo]|nr:hypothetical protein H4582DRAFT_1378279 [Lactarius indigo]